MKRFDAKGDLLVAASRGDPDDMVRMLLSKTAELLSDTAMEVAPEADDFYDAICEYGPDDMNVQDSVAHEIARYLQRSPQIIRAMPKNDARRYSGGSGAIIAAGDLVEESVRAAKAIWNERKASGHSPSP